ncbi:hypothetical protein HYV87_02840, partial [Candidatus Woesearchaeota archaeon]|nr:hypothetical protein [Candidatus Woesearchaeota archaeon]
MAASKKRRKRITPWFVLTVVAISLIPTLLVLFGEGNITGAVISTLPIEEVKEINQSFNETFIETEIPTTLPEEPTTEKNTSPEEVAETEPAVENSETENNLLFPQDLTILNTPTISTLFLNTTNVTLNHTDVNLSAVNISSDTLKIIYNWKRNNSPIAVLIMPFEATNGSTVNNTIDFSGLGNNGNETGGSGTNWSATAGYDGKGAYSFNGLNNNNFITLDENGYWKNLCINGCTFSAWVTVGERETGPELILSRGNGGSPSTFFEFDTGRTAGQGATLEVNFNGSISGNPSPRCSVSTTGGLVFNKGVSWNHIVGVYNLSHIAIYINGTQKTLSACPIYGLNATIWQNNSRVLIGARDNAGSTSNNFNGTIDELMVFNRSLTEAQIRALWLNQTNIIVAQETVRGENWSVFATPLNGTFNGTVARSNNITILNAKPTQATPLLNTTNVSSNNTHVNLTGINLSTADIDNDAVKNIYNWLLNGISIAVLNMPFEGVNSTSYNNTWDYSGYGNNGIIENATWNATGGYDGKGAYEFNGSNGIFIGFADTASLNINGSLTLAAWIKPHPSSATREIIWHGSGGVDYTLRRFSTGELRAIVNNISNTQLGVTSIGSILDESWLHAAVVYNLDNNNLSLYINGIMNASNVSQGHGKLRDSGRFELGNFFPTHTTPFNGTIDEVMVFNRSLSLEQIQALYRNETDTIVAQETAVGEIWSVEVTPNDNFDDGQALISNNVTILNTKPTQATPLLNTTNVSSNNTNVNLTAINLSTADTDGDSIRNIYSWFMDGIPIATLHMPFERINSTSDNNAWDYSGFNRNATPVNASWNATGGFDRRGGYDFKGTSYINVTSSSQGAFTPTSNFTLVVWTKKEQNQNQTGFRAVAATEPYDPADNFGIWSSTNSWYFQVHGDGTDTAITSSGIAYGNWIHLALVFESGTTTPVRFYINGTLASSSTNNPGTLTSRALHIGEYGDGSGFYNGSIDEVMIFNRSLSTEQIFALYQNKTDIIVANETRRGENWSVQITPNDGFDDGQMLQSNNVTILNTKPTHSTPLLNTTDLTTNNTNVNLTAINLSTADIDNDAVKNIYNWFRNGASIAVVNMPFEGINGTTSNNAWDYSGFRNNGSENGGIVWNATGGYDGKGAYEFDSVDDAISTVSQSYTAMANNFTVSAWFKSKSVGIGTGQTIAAHRDQWNLRIQFNIGLDRDEIMFTTDGVQDYDSDFVPAADTWYHVAVVLNSTNDAAIYVNGTLQKVSRAATPASVTAGSFCVGARGTACTASYFNGTIDEVMVYNRSLSEAQIRALYLNQTNIIVAQETAGGENWSVEVTPNDGVEDGQPLTSNTVIILDAIAPSVTIDTPANGSNFSSGNQQFAATVTDTDSGVSRVLFMFNTNTTPFNATATISGSTWNATVNMTIITEGMHTVTAFANDTVGNVNKTVNITITVDRTPPNVSIFITNTTPINNSNFTNSGVIQINVTLNDTLTTVTDVRFGIFNTVNNSEFNLTTIKLGSFWTQNLSLATLTDAVYFIRVHGNDTLGNMNNSVINLSFTVDTVPPNISIFRYNSTSNFTANFSNRGGLQINVSINDTTTYGKSVILGLTHSRNTTGFNVTLNQVDYWWTVNLSMATLSDGVYRIQIYANDTVGNVNNSVANLSFIVDSTPPNVSIFFTNDTATNNSNHTNSGVIQINVTLNDTLTTVTDVRFG